MGPSTPFQVEIARLRALLAQAMGGGGGVTAVTASAPLASSGGATPDISIASPIPIADGGTGQVTALAALNALLPSQGGNNGKVLQTDGTNPSWQTPSGGGSGARAVSLATDENTPSASFADVAGMSVTFTATATKVFASLFFSGETSGSGTAVLQIVSSVGTVVGHAQSASTAAGGNNTAFPCAALITGLTIGNPVTIKVQWRTNAGTLSCLASSAPAEQMLLSVSDAA